MSKMKNYSLEDRATYYGTKLEKELNKTNKSSKNKKDFYMGFLQGVYKGYTKKDNHTKSFLVGFNRGKKARDKAYNIKF